MKRARHEFWEMLREPHVCELFSPPRLTTMCRAQGLRSGWAMDLTQNEELSNPEVQRQVKGHSTHHCVIWQPITCLKLA